MTLCLCIVQGEFEDKNESEDCCLVVLLNDNLICVLPREGSITRRRLWTASSPPLKRTQKPRKQVSLKSSFEDRVIFTHPYFAAFVIFVNSIGL